jgi:ABC transporter
MLNASLSENDAYAACARFAFRNRDARQKVGTLSGGERLRAGLACTLAGARPPWLLILDEPTNHLDIDSVELLEEALREFDGAQMVASHDPALWKRWASSKNLTLSNPGDSEISALLRRRRHPQCKSRDQTPYWRSPRCSPRVPPHRGLALQFLTDHDVGPGSRISTPRAPSLMSMCADPPTRARWQGSQGAISA